MRGINMTEGDGTVVAREEVEAIHLEGGDVAAGQVVNVAAEIGEHVALLEQLDGRMVFAFGEVALPGVHGDKPSRPAGVGDGDGAFAFPAAEFDKVTAQSPGAANLPDELADLLVGVPVFVECFQSSLPEIMAI